MEENKNKNGFFLGVLLGGLIGGVAAYFLSSEDQEEARKNIVKKGKVILKNLDETYEDVKDKGVEVKEAIQEKAEETVENVQDAAQEAVKNIGNTTKRVEKQVTRNASRFFMRQGRSLQKKAGK